ncbi:hypothetical protein E8E12_000443 [Didymella heteroderae]|uniref:Chitin binding n=1 Tax=Didymella heteroderae TaxID=1769908 RepID=A0A9P4WFV7_9PLEO|nr:hypothetical protein E8E12_000443 [Didymella heteroderae]
MDNPDGLSYPANFVVDQYILTYDIACRKGPATGKYCDVLGTEWLNDNADSPSRDCEDCVLGVFQARVNSPADYSEETEEDFRSMTSSCSKTQYPITKPATYALSSWDTAAAVPSPVCQSPLSVQSDDTCNSVSERYNVSSDGLLSKNSIPRSACDGLATYGSLCLPDSCAVHKLDPLDTCESIAVRYGISDTQFLTWNPNIDSLCNNIDNFVHDYICVGPPGGDLGVVTPTMSMPMATPPGPVTVPANAHSDFNRNCGQWYEIQEGDTCEALSAEFGISLRAFYYLNKGIDSNAAISGSKPPTALNSSATWPTYTTTTSSSPPELAWPTFTVTPQLPLAPGTIEGCYEYRNAIPSPLIVDQSKSGKVEAFDPHGNTCKWITSQYEITDDELYEWNPSLSRDICSFQEGFSYCVLKTEDSAWFEPVWWSHCGSRDGMSKNITLNGTDPECDCYVVITGEEVSNNALLTCSGLVEELRLPVANIQKYNSLITEDCDGTLYTGVGEFDERAVCLGINMIKKRPTTSQRPYTPICTFNPKIGQHDCPNVESASRSVVSATASSTGSTPSTASSTASTSLPTNTAYPVSTAGACGTNSPINATCPGSTFGPCCSIQGWCGDTTNHCAADLCYSGECTKPAAGDALVSTDGSCGPSTSNNATCTGSSFGTCCSMDGYCGDSDNHCGAGMCYPGACITSDNVPSPSGECGPLHPGSYVCEGTSFGPCCNQYEYCGSGSDFCGTAE